MAEDVIDSMELMREHIAESRGVKRKRAKKIFQCNKCSMILQNRTAFRNHVRREHDSKPHECDVCGKCFEKPSLVQLHRNRVHEKLVRHQCGVCGKGFFTKYHLESHLKIHTGRKDHECPRCDKSFARRDVLVIHLRSHTGERPFACVHCDYRCADASTLRRHIGRHNDQHRVECRLCGKCYYSKSNLEHHISKEHLGLDVNNFECDHCGKRFYWKNSLVTHIRNVHTGKRKKLKFKCTECNKLFRSEHNLTSHMLVHIDVKTVPCTQCHKTFKHQYYLNRHMKEHYKHTLTNKCDVCQVWFARYDKLLRHKRSMKHKELARFGQNAKNGKTQKGRSCSYACNSCPVTYDRFKELRVHSLAEHGMPINRRSKLQEEIFSSDDEKPLKPKSVDGTSIRNVTSERTDFIDVKYDDSSTRSVDLVGIKAEVPDVEAETVDADAESNQNALSSNDICEYDVEHSELSPGCLIGEDGIKTETPDVDGEVVDSDRNDNISPNAVIKNTSVCLVKVKTDQADTNTRDNNAYDPFNNSNADINIRNTINLDKRSELVINSNRTDKNKLNVITNDIISNDTINCVERDTIQAEQIDCTESNSKYLRSNVDIVTLTSKDYMNSLSNFKDSSAEMIKKPQEHLVINVNDRTTSSGNVENNYFEAKSSNMDEMINRINEKFHRDYLNTSTYVVFDNNYENLDNLRCDTTVFNSIEHEGGKEFDDIGGNTFDLKYNGDCIAGCEIGGKFIDTVKKCEGTLTINDENKVDDSTNNSPGFINETNENIADNLNSIDLAENSIVPAGIAPVNKGTLAIEPNSDCEYSDDIIMLNNEQNASNSKTETELDEFSIFENEFRRSGIRNEFVFNNYGDESIDEQITNERCEYRNEIENGDSEINKNKINKELIIVLHDINKNNAYKIDEIVGSTFKINVMKPASDGSSKSDLSYDESSSNNTNDFIFKIPAVQSNRTCKSQSKIVDEDSSNFVTNEKSKQGFKRAVSQNYRTAKIINEITSKNDLGNSNITDSVLKTALKNKRTSSQDERTMKRQFQIKTSIVGSSKMIDGKNSKKTHNRRKTLLIKKRNNQIKTSDNDSSNIKGEKMLNPMESDASLKDATSQSNRASLMKKRTFKMTRSDGRMITSMVNTGKVEGSSQNNRNKVMKKKPETFTPRFLFNQDLRPDDPLYSIRVGQVLENYKSYYRSSLNARECATCSKLFSTNEELYEHCKQHYGSISMKCVKSCPLCDFTTVHSLKQHMRLKHRGACVTPGARTHVHTSVVRRPGLKQMNESKILKKIASRRVMPNVIVSRKLVKKNGTYYIDNVKTKVNIDTSNVKCMDKVDLSNDDYLEQMLADSKKAKLEGRSFLFPCDRCPKICQKFCGLKLHRRRHNSNAKPFKKKVWKHKLMEQQQEQMKKDGSLLTMSKDDFIKFNKTESIRNLGIINNNKHNKKLNVPSAYKSNLNTKSENLIKKNVCKQTKTENFGDIGAVVATSKNNTQKCNKNLRNVTSSNDNTQKRVNKIGNDESFGKNSETGSKTIANVADSHVNSQTITNESSVDESFGKIGSDTRHDNDKVGVTSTGMIKPIVGTVTNRRSYKNDTKLYQFFKNNVETTGVSFIHFCREIRKMETGKLPDFIERESSIFE